MSFLSSWCTILGNADGITLGFDVGTDLGSSDEPLDSSNDGNLEGLLLGGSLVSTDGKVIGSDDGLVLYLEMYIDSHLGWILEQI